MIKIPFKWNTDFAPSETQGYGILNEMSLLELKERLNTKKNEWQKFYYLLLWMWIILLSTML